MKRYFITICATIILALAMQSCRKEVKESRLVKVETLTVGSDAQATTTDFPGRVKASEEVNMAFKVSGTLARVYVDEGDKVRKGQIVAELDPTDYQTQLAATEAEYYKIKSEAERVIALYNDSVATAGDYDKARYGLQQISAKYKHAKDQLADTRIYAPFSGTVKKRIYDPPTVLGAGMPVLSIITDNSLEIEINIPASTYVNRSSFTSFTTSFDFLESKTVDLKLISISPAANANQLYTVRLAVPNGVSNRLSPGMNAMVHLSQTDVAVSSSIEIPTSAIFEDNGNSFVWIFNASNGKLSRHQIEVERLDTKGNAVIKSGLKAGEEIVTSGVHKLKDGQTVERLAPASETNVGGLL
ncbi:MAG: efflux RND transporter periplasmic adaptor subunit [Candidatus Limisoma sp.]